MQYVAAADSCKTVLDQWTSSEKSCWKFVHPKCTFTTIKQEAYTDIADKDYQNKTVPPAPCSPIN